MALTQIFAFASKKGAEHIGCEMAGVGSIHTSVVKDCSSSFLLMRIHDVTRYWKHALGRDAPNLVALRAWLSSMEQEELDRCLSEMEMWQVTVQGNDALYVPPGFWTCELSLGVVNVGIKAMLLLATDDLRPAYGLHELAKLVGENVKPGATPTGTAAAILRARDKLLDTNEKRQMRP